MRRLILAVLVISVILLGACVEPASAPSTSNSTITPETEPAPEPEPEESPVSMPFVASELRNLNNAMATLTSWPKYILYPRDDSWEHWLNVWSLGEAGCGYGWTMPASNIFEARAHIGNAYWLTNKSRLPGEVTMRDIYTDEITQEVNEAKMLLEQQVSYSYSHQDAETKWIIENKIPSQIGGGFLTQAKKEVIIENLNDIYIEYREELSRVITRLELVLSKLPKDNIIFSLE